MNNLDTATLMKEARFTIDELFFSITDYDSTILSSNETFVRISGFNEDEIIGHYHNVVRHHDMPRVIFKLFWDYLKADKPVVAYVKNKTKEGNFYWVLAAVFPLNDQYISIRIKPTTPIFDATREIYFRLLMAETKLEMQESEALLLELLKGAGFDDYDHFMNEVLLAELSNRKKLLLEQSTKVDDDINTYDSQKKDIRSLYDISNNLLHEYEKWFEKIESFQRVKNTFEEKGLSLRMLARDIVLLSLNASVASYKLEENGETFGVLASDIRKNAKENDALIIHLDTIATDMSDALNEIIFLVSYTSLQMEMVNYFIKELLHSSEKKLDNSVNALYTLVSEYNEKLVTVQHQVEKITQKSISALEELERQFMYLGYVQIYGIIESSRDSDDRLGFSEIFSQLKSLVARTTEEVFLMKSVSESFSVENNQLLNNSSKIENMLHCLESEIISINTKED